jgi:hypothetical protein
MCQYYSSFGEGKEQHMRIKHMINNSTSKHLHVALMRPKRDEAERKKSMKELEEVMEKRSPLKTCASMG